MKEIIKLISKLRDYRIEIIPVLSARYDEKNYMSRVRSKYPDVVKAIQKGQILTEQDFFDFVNIKESKASVNKNLKADFEIHLRNSLVFMEDSPMIDRQNLYYRLLEEAANVFFLLNNKQHLIFLERIKEIGNYSDTLGFHDIASPIYRRINNFYSNIQPNKKAFKKYAQLLEETTEKWRQDEVIEEIFENVFIEIKTSKRLTHGLMKKIGEALDTIEATRKTYQSPKVNTYYFQLKYIYLAKREQLDALLTMAEEAIKYFSELKVKAPEQIMRYHYIKGLVLMEQGEKQKAKETIKTGLTIEKDLPDNHAELLLLLVVILISEGNYEEALGKVIPFVRSKSAVNLQRDILTRWQLMVRWLLILEPLSVLNLSPKTKKIVEKFVVAVGRKQDKTEKTSRSALLLAIVEKMLNIQSGNGDKELRLLRKSYDGLSQKERKKDRHYLFMQFLESMDYPSDRKKYWEKLKKIQVRYVYQLSDIEYVPYGVIGSRLVDNR